MRLIKAQNVNVNVHSHQGSTNMDFFGADTDADIFISALANNQYAIPIFLSR